MKTDKRIRLSRFATDQCIKAFDKALKRNIDSEELENILDQIHARLIRKVVQKSKPIR